MRRGFSLTELLVVLAIVLVIIGLLLPALVVARRSAQRAACAANLAQCGRAFQSYASAHGDLIPRAYAISGTAPQWTAVLAKELGVKVPFDWPDVIRLPSLHCPSHVTENITSSWVVNAFTDEAGLVFTGFTKLSSLKPPSEMPLLLETPALFNATTFFPFDDIFAEEARFVCSADHLVGGRRCRLGVANHGRGVSNVLFVDGHVQVTDNGRLKVRDFLPR